MLYEELSKQITQLSYRDKFRLAQLLIQPARKEEEEAHPQRRKTPQPNKIEPETIQYIADRLRKLKPSKKDSVFNCIGAMFQFKGSICDRDKERIFAELHKAGHIDLGKNGRIQYPCRPKSNGGQSRGSPRANLPRSRIVVDQGQAVKSSR